MYMSDMMRQHKRIVFTFALLAMVGTGFYGVMYMVRPSEGHRAGPWGTYYALDGAGNYMTPELLFQERLNRTNLLRPMRGEYGSADVLRELTQYRLAADMGFDCGRQELTDAIKQDLRNRTRMATLTEEVYQRVLSELQLTQRSYERLLRERATRIKYMASQQEQGLVTEGALYINYAMRHQQVRVFYKEFFSEKYEDLAATPSPEEIKEYYEKHKGKDQDPGDSLFTKPQLSVDVLYVAAADVAKRIAPKEEELKEYYERYKSQYSKPGAAPGAPDAERYRPFAEVKDLVLKDYRDSKLQDEANKLVKEWDEALKAEEVKAEQEKKPVDLAAFAKARGIRHWRSDRKTFADFEKAGAPKVDARDFSLAADAQLFTLAEKSDKEDEEKTRVESRKRLLTVRRIQAQTADDGYATMRLAEYEPGQLMKLEDATPIIRRRIQEQRAAEKAKAAAEEFRQKWAQGQEKPKPEDLKDELCKEDSRNVVAQQFLRQATPLGELLPVIEAPLDAEWYQKNPDTKRACYVVGFVAECRAPGYDVFDKDLTDHSRPTDRMRLGRARQWFLQRRSLEYLTELRKFELPQNIRDVDLYRAPSPEPMPLDL